MVWAYERHNAHREKWNLLLDTLTQWGIKELLGSETSSKVPIFIAGYSYFIINMPLEGQIFFQVDSFCCLDMQRYLLWEEMWVLEHIRVRKKALWHSRNLFYLCDPISHLIIMWGLLWYSTMCIASILRPVGPMGNHILVCSWMLVEKAEKTLWRRKITV